MVGKVEEEVGEPLTERIVEGGGVAGELLPVAEELGSTLAGIGEERKGEREGNGTGEEGRASPKRSQPTRWWHTRLRPQAAAAAPCPWPPTHADQEVPVLLQASTPRPTSSP